MEKTVFTFGRFNPPTLGHEKLVNRVKELAQRQNAEPHVFLSHSQNSNKDPLNYQQKFKYAKQSFGDVVYRSNSKTIIQIMQELEKMGHKEVTMVVGSDRVQEFRNLLSRYNGKDYTFDKVKVVSAGDRDPDAEGVLGMSASKMRARAAEGDFRNFKNGTPSKMSHANISRMYNDLRRAMNIKEGLESFDWDYWADTVNIDDIEILDEAVLSLQQRIKRARDMKRRAPRMKNMKRIKKFKMADKQKLMKRARKQAIKMFRKKVAGEKGEHYAQLSPAAKISVDKLIQKKLPAVGRLAQRLLPKVRRAEMERLRSLRKGKTNEQLEEGNKAQLGIPANATNAQLRKIRSSDTSTKQQKQRAHWLLNMRKEEVAQDKDIEDRKGTQPKKYFKDLPKSTKVSRDAHFKKYAKKDDSDPSNYKPAPGDKDAKTKPSVHTKKYKQMYGESLDNKFEALMEQEVAARVSGPSTTQTQQRHSAEKQRLRDKQKREREQLKARQDRQKNRSQIRDIRSEQIELKEIDALKKKAEKSGISYGTLKRVYDRGMAAWKSGHRPGTTPQQWAFARVNSFITKGKGTWGGADKDLASKVKKESIEWKIDKDADYPENYPHNLNEAFQMHITQPTGYGQMVTAKEAGIEIQAGFAMHPSVSEEGGAGEYGTDKLVKKYKDETPGETIKEEAWLEFESCCEDCMEQLQITEAEYQGKKVKLNDPIRTSENPKKKFKVYVRDPSSGNIKVVRFGDPGLSIKRDDPGRRRNFRARHSCDNPGPITKARYWSCRMWSKKNVSDLD